MNKRFELLDFLRGFFICLALLEHYSYTLNVYFVEKMPGLEISYLPVDIFSYSLMKYFGPWVGQAFLALACFNLVYFSSKKLNFKKYFFIFSLFSLEHYILTDSIGEFLTFSLVQLWIIVLIYFHFMLKNFSMRITALVSSVLASLPIIFESSFASLSLSIDQALPGVFSLEANPLIYIGAGLIGVLAGKFWGKLFTKRSLVTFILFLGTCLYLSPEFHVEKTNVMMNEYDWSYSLWGSLSVWTILYLIFVSAQFCFTRGYQLQFRPMNFIGRNSLYYFLFHQIFYTFFYLPGMIYLLGESSIRNDSIFNIAAITAYTLLFYGIIRLGNYLASTLLK